MEMRFASRIRSGISRIVRFAGNAFSDPRISLALEMDRGRIFLALLGLIAIIGLTGALIVFVSGHF